MGVADGRFAAAIAARKAAARGAPVIVPAGVEATARFLAPLPVQLLASVAGLDDDFVQLLQRLGVRQLGQLAALSAADVLARFGRQGEFAHRIASGGDDRPPDTVAAAQRARRHAGARRPGPSRRHVGVRRPAVGRRAVERAERRRQGVHAVDHHRRDRSQRAQRTAVVSLDRIVGGSDGRAGPMATRCLGQQCRRSSAGVTMLRLEPIEVRSDDGVQLGLWGGRTQADEWAARAVARLATLAGAEHVVVPGGSGWPAAGRCLRLGAGSHRRSRRAGPTPDPIRGSMAGHAAEPVAGSGARRTGGDRRPRQGGQPVRVTGRGAVSAVPATVQRMSGTATAAAAGAGRRLGRSVAVGGTLVGRRPGPGDRHGSNC